MKQILLLLFILSLSAGNVFSQGKRANNWYFGFFAGLSFNAGSPPEVLYDGQTDFSYDGAATISDEEGNLLFYSNGAKLWNKEHQRMQNSLGIGDYSPQGAMIVPDPGNPDLYYIFNFRADGPSITHFQYSVIDMRLDSGMGGVIPEKKTILLLQNTTFHLSAVQHTNGEDVWVVVHKVDNIDYYSYKITRNGIENPVISNAGTLFQSRFGYLKFSPNGKKIGAALYAWNNTCEILDFNAETGEIIDDNLISTSKGALGIEFSPDNSKVYINSGGVNSLYQYDLNAGSPAEILASEVLLTTEVLSSGALQLGPDGKIYCATDAQYVGVIHDPNKIGLECNYERYSIYIGDGRLVGEGLPSFIQSYLNDPEYATSQHCAGQPTQFNIANTNGIDSVKWKFKDFGNMPNDTSSLFNPLYTFSAPGTYYPELTVWSGLLPPKTVKDTVAIYASPTPNLGNDTTFCPNDPINLTLDAGPGEQYAWNNNFPTVDSTFIVTDVGTYWVRVIDHGCFGRDTINVSRYEAATIDLTNLDITPSNCGLSDGSITGIQFSAPDPFTVTWLDAGGTDIGSGNDLLNVSAGSYVAEVTYGNNCNQTFGPYSIADNNAHVIAGALPEDDDHCYQGMGSIIVTPESGSVTDYQYSFNGTDFFPLTAVITGLTAGPYNITLKDQFGCISAAALVEVSNVEGPTINCIPTPESGSNGDGTITVISPNINLTYQLEGGLPQSGNVFTGLSAATYYVIVTDEFGCFTRDTVIVENHTGTLLVALADHDRKCLYKPASSDIRIARVTDMKDLKATLYFNDNILNCTHFNANTSDFPDITAQLFTTPPRVEIEWHGATSITNADTLFLGSMIFETLQQGVADITWEANSTITYFLNVSGDSIQPYFFPGEIIVHEIPEININQPPAVCEQGSITLIPQITGGTDPMEYAWLTPNGTSHSQELEVLNAESGDAGNYQFTVSDNFYCADTVQVNLTVIPLPTANFPTINDTIPFEQHFTLEATPGYFSYEWNTGDTTYFITGTEEGNYSVIIKTQEGCTAIDSAYLKDVYMPFYFNVPNAFTPDGDGLNDIFRPIATTDLIRQFSMVIYNRWGQLIFETTNPANGWDGKDAPAGVYTWVISYSDLVGKVAKMRGIVTLLR